MKKLLISVTLVLVICLSGISYAENNTGAKLAHISNVKAILNIASGTADVMGQVYSANVQNVSILACLQRQSNTGRWITIDVWYSSSHSGYANIHATYSVSSGYNYRVYAVAKAYDASDNVLETAYSTSETIWY